MPLDLLAIAAGATLGAWLRFGLSVWLNPRVPHFPLGTLAANLLGGYLVGIAVAFFVARADIPAASHSRSGFVGSAAMLSMPM